MPVRGSCFLYVFSDVRLQTTFCDGGTSYMENLHVRIPPQTFVVTRVCATFAALPCALRALGL